MQRRETDAELFVSLARRFDARITCEIPDVENVAHFDFIFINGNDGGGRGNKRRDDSRLLCTSC